MKIAPNKICRQATSAVNFSSRMSSVKVEKVKIANKTPVQFSGFNIIEAWVWLFASGLMLIFSNNNFNDK
jgi:hypothetical protein